MIQISSLTPERIKVTFPYNPEIVASVVVGRSFENYIWAGKT